MKVVNSIIELIGNTPIIKLSNLTNEKQAQIFLKLECYNPAGSVKDRPALYMIEMAEREGLLKKDSVIIEPTSGNMGIGLAMVGGSKGYKVIIVMPDNMSIERRQLLKAYGAEVILTPGDEGMKGSIAVAEKLVKENENYYMPRQFDNSNNSKSHELTTSRELIEQMDGDIDMLVAGIGTGGTITGVGRELKKDIPNVKVIGVEPAASPVLSGGKPGLHKIQGIGPNFVPNVLDLDVIDKVEQVACEEAIEMTKLLALREKLLVGISSGAAVFAAYKMSNILGYGKKIVVIAPDSGERYLSTGIYD